jgi:hypothetical protein
MNLTSVDLSLLTAMITPAVLISACGILILSTSTRLARIVDRVRALSRALEQPHARTIGSSKQSSETERQISAYARRGRLLQAALTCVYLSLGIFVATTTSIGLASFLPVVAWLPTMLGMAGTVVLLYACLMLIGETRLALGSVIRQLEAAAAARPRKQADAVSLD